MKIIILGIIAMLSISYITTAQNIQLNDPLPFLGNVELFKIAPDGNTVVYLADQITDGVFELFSAPVTGGTPIRLNANLPEGGDVLIDDTAFRISPDSNTVLYTAEQNANGVFELFSVPITGGTPTRLNDDLASSGNVLDFAITPDGSRAVYFADQNANNRNELFSVPITGGTVTQLTDFSAGGDAIFFSDQMQITSDSSTVVYVADPNIDAVNEIFSVPITGGTPTQLNPNLIAGGDVAGDFALSPDGNIVVYAADQIADGFREIFAAPINGGTAIRLNDNLPIADGGGDVEEFAISPDGNNVVYLADQITTDLVEMFAVPITGGTPLRISPDFMMNSDVTDFIISSDSANVVYRADLNIGNVFELFSVPMSGGVSVQLSIPLSGIQDVRDDYQISSDGQTVIHRSDPDSFNVIELFSTPITGGTIVQLNNDLVSGGDVSGFIISGDSNTVVFRADQDTNNVIELYGVSIFGGNVALLNGALTNGGDTQTDFAVTANGSQLVYLADQDVDQEFEVFSTQFDVAPPIAICQTLTVSLDDTGNIAVSANVLDGGSSDNVGVVSFNLNTNNFTCDDLGNQTVILTVSDAAGNSASCTTTVTITDTIAPIINCPTNDVTVIADDIDIFVVPDFSEGIISDNCTELVNLIITQNPAIGSTLTIGTSTVTIIVTDASGNENECEFTLIVDENLNLDENSLNQQTVKLFPNPATDHIQLEYNGVEIITGIVIFDLNGRIVQQQSLNQNTQSQTIPLNNLKFGLYFVQITSQQNQITKKLVIK